MRKLAQKPRFSVRNRVRPCGRIASFAFAFSVLALPVLTYPARSESKAAATADPTAQTSCRGTNLLDEFKTSDPAAYSKIETDAKATENARAILWKIEKPGVAPSHLFGTIHLTDPRVTEVPAPALKALSAASVLVVEIADLSAQTSAAGLAAAMQLAIYTDGRSLEAHLSAEELTKVRDTLTRSGIPADAAKLLKPWIISMLLAASDCERRKMQEGTPVLDMKLVALAKSQKTPVIGLETIESQLQALSSIPEDEQVKMLKSALVYADRADDLVETTLQFYLTRNMGAVWPFQLALAHKAGFQEGAFAGAHSTLIDDRNLKMRDGALSHLEKGAAFIAVGALHLPGPGGLVALLREKGYTLTPVE